MDAQRLMELADFWPGRILLTANDLGFFPHLQIPRSAEEIADIGGGLDVESTSRILKALTAMEILVLKNGRYEIAAELKEPLGDGGNTILPSLTHRSNLWIIWSELTEIVRTGKHYDALVKPRPQTEERQQEFSRAMAVVGKGVAAETAHAIDFSGIQRVLDIGGAPAIYAGEFLKIKPDLHIFILDRPGANEIVDEMTAGTHAEEKIGFIEGDALQIEDSNVIGKNGSGRFDMIFMSNLIHSMSPDEIKELFTRCVRWCAPGGRILVKDFLMDDTRTIPAR